MSSYWSGTDSNGHSACPSHVRSLFEVGDHWASVAILPQLRKAKGLDTDHRVVSLVANL